MPLRSAIMYEFRFRTEGGKLQVSQLCSSTRKPAVPHRQCEGGVKFDLSGLSLKVRRDCVKQIKHAFRTKAHFVFHKRPRVLVCVANMSQKDERQLASLRRDLIAFVSVFTEPYPIQKTRKPKDRLKSDVRVARRSARPINAVQASRIPTQREPAVHAKPFSPAPRLTAPAFTIY